MLRGRVYDVTRSRHNKGCKLGGRGSIFEEVFQRMPFRCHSVEMNDSQRMQTNTVLRTPSLLLTLLVDWTVKGFRDAVFSGPNDQTRLALDYWLRCLNAG
jgi:hypothetical protein